MTARAAPSALSSVDHEPGVAKPDPLLVVEGAFRHFGGVTAVDVGHLEIQRNVITALIGPNGAGKTTLFNVLSGFDRAEQGRWRFDGTDITGWPPHRIARRGMVRTFQLTKTLARMTVLENLLVGGSKQTGERLLTGLIRPLWSGQERELTTRADEVLERFRLSHLRDEFAGTLSGGQRKLLEMARALMADPILVMLDEPMAGVNPVLTESLLEHISGLREQGLTVLFVEHDMDVVGEVSDWVVCLGQGAVIAEGPPSAVGSNQVVIDAYLGTSRDRPERREEAP